METITKVLLVVAIGYNAVIGAFIEVTSGSFIIVLFLCIDFFLIFYYMWLLLRQNYGLFQFEKTHKDLIRKAREEVRSRGS